MRNNYSNISEFELVPSDLNLPARKEVDYKTTHATRRKWRPAMLWRPRPAKYCFYTLPLLLGGAPVVLLIAFSPKLSRQLGSNGCTPSGEFVIPYTTSIWDPSRFFAITIVFVGPPSRYCQVIDIAWDILVGWGGQAVAVLAAYHLFGRVVKVLMQQGEVGYDLFSSVAFDAGSVSSFATMTRHAAGFTPIPRTRRAMVVFVGMAAATLYIVVVPSLLAAMTGYTSYYDASLELDVRAGVIYGATIDCFGPVVPLWGRVEPISAGIYNAITWLEDAPYPITFLDNGDADWIEYYNHYRDVYEACPVQFNIWDCEQARQPTDYHLEGSLIKIPSPMPGIIPYSIDSTGGPKYTHWLCGTETFTLHQLQGGNNTLGVCNADNGYAWGFSFLLTFVTAVLTLVFVLIMYGLWFEARRHNGSAQEVGHLKDAVTMVTLAQQQYGPKIGEWSSDTLQREIVAGKVGMSFAENADGIKLRKRKGPSRREQEFGDPRAGDWGGDVYVSDLR